MISRLWKTNVCHLKFRKIRKNKITKQLHYIFTLFNFLEWICLSIRFISARRNFWKRFYCSFVLRWESLFNSTLRKQWNKIFAKLQNRKMPLKFYESNIASFITSSSIKNEKWVFMSISDTKSATETQLDKIVALLVFIYFFANWWKSCVCLITKNFSQKHITKMIVHV